MGRKISKEEARSITSEEGREAAKAGKKAETPHKPNPDAKPIDPKTQLPSNNPY
jgi:hypothetical protein